MSTTERSAGDKLFDAFSDATRGPLSDRRQSDRRPWVSQITVNWPTEGEVRNFGAVAHDLSPAGVSFFAQQSVPVGSAIVTQFVGLPGCPKVGGVVRHTERFGEMHRIGVEFQ